MAAFLFLWRCSRILEQKGLDEVSLLPKLQASLSRLQRQHGERLTPQSRVVVAVSGGRDSVALLHGLMACGWHHLVICHVNHRLRGVASGQDAAFVRRLGKKLGVIVEVGCFDVARYAEANKRSLELAARLVREEFFQEICERHATPFVFLGHHADDQAETILGNLCRGAGLRGLAGMSLSLKVGQGSAGGKMVKLRPLLQVSRMEIDDYVQEQKLAFREDASNAQPIFRRNRLRLEVLPLLNEVFQREVVSIIAKTGVLAGQDDECLQELARQFIESEEVFLEGGALKITTTLKQLHDAVLSRVLRQWLQHIDEDTGIGFVEIESAMQMLRSSEAPARINLSQQRWLCRKARRLTVRHDG